MKLILLFCFVATVVSQDAADDFESYALGPFVTGSNGGTGWTSSWTVTPGSYSIDVVTASLSYNAIEVDVDGGSQAIQVVASSTNTNAFPDVLARSITSLTGSGTTAYYSFLFRDTVNSDSGVGNDFAQFGFRDTTPDQPKASVIRFDDISQARVGVFNNGDTVDGPMLDFNQTHFIVLKVENTGSAFDTVSIFVNPTAATSEPAPDATANSGNALTSLDVLTVRLARPESGDTFLFDNFLVGSTWASVVPAVNVTFELPLSIICTLQEPVALTQGTPAGGVYSGPGVYNVSDDYFFNPAVTGAGLRTITYSIGSISDQATIEVFAPETPCNFARLPQNVTAPQCDYQGWLNSIGYACSNCGDSYRLMKTWTYCFSTDQVRYGARWAVLNPCGTEFPVTATFTVANEQTCSCAIAPPSCPDL